MLTSITSDHQRRTLYITQRSGVILQVPVRTERGRSFPVPQSASHLDLSAKVSIDGERGMFDLELIPDQDRAVVSYTALDGAVVVRLLRVEGLRLIDDVPDPTVVSIPHPFAGHNGGGLAFNTSGDLMVSVGDMDLYSSDEPPSQDLTTPLGSVLRIPSEVLEDRASRPFTPSENDIVAKGLRNPWKIHRDRVTDDLWIADVGQESWEEIDVLPSVSTFKGVTNFGWPIFEGFEDLRPEVDPVGEEPVTDPVYAYPHGSEACAVSGGVLYRGEQLPALVGAYVFGDLCSGSVRAIRRLGSDVTGPVTVVEVGGGKIVAVGEDALGELYVLTMDGDLYRIDPADWRVADVGDPEVPPQRESSFGATSETESVPTSPAVELTSAECAVVDSLLVLRDYRDLSPTRLELELTELIGVIRDAVDASPQDQEANLEVLLRTFESLADVLSSVGWDPKDPLAEEQIRVLESGQGTAEGFAAAVGSLMSAASSCD